MRRIWRGTALFLILVLIDEWGGWHRVKGDQKEEEVLSSQAANSQERAVRENQLDENEVLETKDEMRGDEQPAQEGSHEKLRKRGVEDDKTKKRPGIQRPIADEIGAKKKKKERKACTVVGCNNIHRQETTIV
jgi:hypothetical protein